MMRRFYTQEKAEQMFRDTCAEELESMWPNKYRCAFIDWLEHERITLIKPHLENTMTTYGNHTLLIERNQTTGAIHISAIPDTGDTIRRTYYGHTKAEALRLIKQEIKNESV